MTTRLLHVFPSFSIGGAQARMITLANAFGPEFSHTIVAMDGQSDARERLAPELDVAMLAPPLRKGDLVGNILAIRRVLRETRPDVLITSNWGSIEWAMANRVAGIPHIHTEDGFGPEERDRQLTRRVLTRRAVLGRSAVMVPSKVLERIARDTWKLRPGTIRYIPNGIDLRRFVPATVQRDRLVIGTVAGLRAEKNVGRLLEAFALLAKRDLASLLIVGEGPERDALERKAAELGVAADTEFAGNVVNPAPSYGRMDIFALSSDTEQMPISVLEAMASGLPIAATNVGDVMHMVSVDNGAFVTPKDAPALAKMLGALIEDATVRARLGAANRAKAEMVYALDVMVKAHADLIAEALASRSRGAGIFAPRGKAA